MVEFINFLILYRWPIVASFLALIILISYFCASPIPFFLQWLSYYPRYFFGRLRLSAKLKKASEKEGVRVVWHRKDACLARPADEDCEFCVVTPKACCAVKLFGHANRHLRITLTDRNVYFTQKPCISRFTSRRSRIHGTTADPHACFYDPVLHEIPSYRFFGEDETQAITPVLLINPCESLVLPKNTFPRDVPAL